MNEAGVVAAHAERHLADGFHKRQRLNVAHRTADFHDANIGLAAVGRSRTAGNKFLNFIGDMRNHLHGLAEVFAAALLLQNALVDLTRREVVGLMHLRGDEALIVAEVKVSLRTVFRHEHFAVLERRHRTRIHIDVRVELDHRNLEAARFENGRKRSCGNTLAERGHDAAGDKYVLGHNLPTDERRRRDKKFKAGIISGGKKLAANSRSGSLAKYSHALGMHCKLTYYFNELTAFSSSRFFRTARCSVLLTKRA